MAVDYLRCTICLSSHNSDQWTVLPCGHYLHFVCCQQWLERTRACPICRVPVTYNGECINLYDVNKLEKGEEDGFLETQQDLQAAEDVRAHGEERIREVREELNRLREELMQAVEKLKMEKRKYADLENNGIEQRQYSARLLAKLRDKEARTEQGVLEIAELKLKLKVAESRLLERRLMPSDPSLTRPEELQREMQRVLGNRREANGDTNKMLMRSIVSSKQQFQQLDAQYKQDIEGLKRELRAEKQKAAETKRSLKGRLAHLQKETEALRAQQEQEHQRSDSGLQSGRAAAQMSKEGSLLEQSLDWGVEGGGGGGVREAEGGGEGERKGGLVAGEGGPPGPDELLGYDEDELELLGLAGPGSLRPSFTVRPGSGVRPPAMLSSGATPSLVLQGADGRGGRVMAPARRMVAPAPSSVLSKGREAANEKKKQLLVQQQGAAAAAASAPMRTHCPLSSLKAPPRPLADKTNLAQGGRLVLPPAPKRARGNHIKAAATKDIADYFGRGR